MNINRQYFKLLLFAVYSMIAGSICLVMFHYLPDTIGLVASVLISGVLVLIQKHWSPEDAVTVIFVYMLFIYFMYDVLDLYLKISISYTAKYSIDILIAMFSIRLYKLIFRKHQGIFVSVYVFICLIGLLGGLANPNSTATDVFKVFELFVRILPLYFFIQQSQNSMERYFSVIYIVNIFLIFGESFAKFFVDSRNGLWGTYGQGPSMLFFGIRLGFLLSDYISKKVTLSRFLSEYILIMIVFLLTESKSMIIIYNIAAILSLLLTKAKGVRQFAIVGVTVAGIVTAIRLIVRLYPKFRRIFSLAGFENYLLGNSNGLKFTNGRIEAGLQAFQTMCITGVERFFGRGFGSAIPPENVNYIAQSGVSEHFTYILNMFGLKFGYYLSAFSYLLIELGYSGIFLIITVVGAQLYFSIQLLRSTPEDSRYGFALFMVACANTYFMSYGSAFISLPHMAITFILLGLCRQRVRNRRVLNESRVAV